MCSTSGPLVPIYRVRGHMPLYVGHMGWAYGCPFPHVSWHLGPKFVCPLHIHTYMIVGFSFFFMPAPPILPLYVGQMKCDGMGWLLIIYWWKWKPFFLCVFLSFLIWAERQRTIYRTQIEQSRRAEEKVGHLLQAGASYTYIIYSF